MTHTADDIDNIINHFDEFAHQMLKTHLVVETRVNEMLGCVCKQPKAVQSRRFGFWEKCRILEAVLGPQKRNVWVALDKFNAIRNEIAHTLGAQEKARLVDDFTSALGLSTKGMDALKPTEEYRLETCFFGFVMLIDWLDKMKEAANQVSDVTTRNLTVPKHSAFDDKKMKTLKCTTITGYENKNGQVVLRRTSHVGTDHNQCVYMLKCKYCGAVYGANGSDIWQRKCPELQSKCKAGGGKPGIK